MSNNTKYPENSILIVGNSQTTSLNPINQQFGAFFISFILLKDTEEILDCGVSMTLKVTESFVQGIFLGRRLVQDEEIIVSDVQARYFGSSQKAIIAAYRDAIKKYKEVTAPRKT
ncbi:MULTISPECIES: DUF3870 domain-containing protein [Aminobacterium]|jgi:hypothetical protein|uniref:DUF3870 domain-containing protein n=1 Tax=Aminobacterium TaxID=81466 RepID=UPI0004675C88|nr:MULTISPECIES: DUF3870 domain-containing protein [Aminobacterium]